MLMRARLLARAQPLLARSKDAFVRYAGSAPSTAPPKNFFKEGQIDGGFFQVNFCCPLPAACCPLPAAHCPLPAAAPWSPDLANPHIRTRTH
jgi:hypothetical protein